MTKPCRYCYSDVHRSAKICPICHNAQTTIGITKSLLMTVFPILTTIASLGIAYYEKAERDAAVVQLEREKLSATAATELADELSESLSDSQLASTYYSTYGRLPTQERLEEVNKIALQQKKEKTLSNDELIKLSKERKELRLMFKRTSSKKRKNLNKKSKQQVTQNTRSFQNSGEQIPSSFASGSRVVPASGNIQSLGNQQFTPIQNSPQSNNRTFGTLQNNTLLQRNAKDSQTVPQAINIKGKKVTPLVNLPTHLIKEAQSIR